MYPLGMNKDGGQMESAHHRAHVSDDVALARIEYRSVVNVPEIDAENKYLTYPFDDRYNNLTIDN